MLYIEVSKKKTKKNNIIQTIKDGWYNVWDDKRIQGAFNFGRGTIKDLKRYAENNKQYCYIINPADGTILNSSIVLNPADIYKSRQIWENI